MFSPIVSDMFSQHSNWWIVYRMMISKSVYLSKLELCELGGKWPIWNRYKIGYEIQPELSGSDSFVFNY